MPKTSSKKFFQEQTVYSRVKAAIIAKFVPAWLGVVLNARGRPSQRRAAAYVDLFSGPGSYQNGSRSTPLLVVEATLKKPLFRERLKTYFNDENIALTESLKQEIGFLPDVAELSWPPVYTSRKASIALIQSFDLAADTPKFFFLDQFGWSDVTPELIRYIFASPRCDCAFFFRTSRVVAAVYNSKMAATMTNIFGQERLARLQQGFSRKENKEELLLKELQDAMKEAGAPFFHAFPFRLRNEASSKHHLIYLGKHQKGLSIMKEIMGRISSSHEGGVPIVGFSEVPAYPSLFEVDLIPELEESLIAAFAGTRLSVADVYSRHHPTNSRFLLKNYQEALRRLEEKGLIVAFPGAAKRPKRNSRVTMAENVETVFPENGES